MHPMIKQQQAEILRLATQHKIRSVRLFGSFVRWEETADSDVDLLVLPEDGASGFDLGGFLMDMQDLFQRKVDVVSERALHPLMREQVLREAETI